MAGEILTPRETRRYLRQIMIPEIGKEGQEKIKQARIMVVGAGGLGCPVLQYLTASGVGKIGIVEFDKVDETNLQRQVLYGAADLGKLKSIIAIKHLEYLNPLVETETINLRLDSENALGIFKDYDIIVDSTDNFEARYIINDSCVILNKPMVHGSIYKFEGQVSVFNYKGGATYRCYNPAKNQPGLKDPDPAETGIPAVLPGITGTLMANEVIKIISGYGEILSGKVLVFNIARLTFTVIRIKNMPENHNIREVKINQ